MTIVQAMTRSSRALATFLPALYPVAVLLTVAPLIDMFGVVGRAESGGASWRLGIMGLGFNALVVHTLGLSLALGVAACLGHRRTLRAVSAVTLVAAVLVVAGIARFLLDYGLIKDLVPSGERAAFEAAAFRALVLASLTVPVLVVLGGKGWLAAAAREPESDTSPPPRIIPFPGRSRAPDPRWPR